MRLYRPVRPGRGEEIERSQRADGRAERVHVLVFLWYSEKEKCQLTYPFAPRRACFAAMKIDVEGHEAAALHGAQGVMRGPCPPCDVIVEHKHRPAVVGNKRRQESPVALLRQWSYRCYDTGDEHYHMSQPRCVARRRGADGAAVTAAQSPGSTARTATGGPHQRRGRAPDTTTAQHVRGATRAPSSLSGCWRASSRSGARPDGN